VKDAHIIPMFAIVIACAQHSVVARELCDTAARNQGNPSEATPQAWIPSAFEREFIWSQVLQASESQPVSDAYGIAPPSGGPLCFLRTSSIEVAVVYVDQNGIAVLQPFMLGDGSWLIDYGEALVILQPD
jgi:hypothetical protein